MSIYASYTETEFEHGYAEAVLNEPLAKFRADIHDVLARFIRRANPHIFYISSSKHSGIFNFRHKRSRVLQAEIIKCLSEYLLAINPELQSGDLRFLLNLVFPERILKLPQRDLLEKLVFQINAMSPFISLPDRWGYDIVKTILNNYSNQLSLWTLEEL